MRHGHSVLVIFNTCILKLYDRRYACQLRRDEEAAPWDLQIEHHYREYIRTGDRSALFDRWSTGFSEDQYYEDEQREQWTRATLETYLQFLCHQAYNTEKHAYNLMRDIQGIHVPTFRSEVTLSSSESRSSCVDSPSIYLNCPGILLQHIEGFPLTDLANNIHRQYWQPTCEEAINIIHQIGDRGICNKDVKTRSFIICKGLGHLSPRVFMVDFGSCVFKDQARNEHEFREWQADQDEEGAIGCVMERLLNGGYKYYRSERADRLLFEFKITRTNKSGYDTVDFIMHGQPRPGFDLGCVPDIAAALPKLKKFLKVSDRHGLTLMKCADDTLTRTNKNLAPLKYIGTPAMHGYTDQQPLHLINLPSIHATSDLLPEENRPLDALWFRANIYITGAPAFAEETWKRYRISPAVVGAERRADVAPTVSVVCRTSRCTMPNVNPITGIVSQDLPPADRTKGKPQPSTTLVKHRTVESGNPAALGYMGMHCVPEDSGLRMALDQNAGLYVEVGDVIEVLETGSHLYGSTANEC